jgi:hypothetical protein
MTYSITSYALTVLSISANAEGSSVSTGAAAAGPVVSAAVFSVGSEPESPPHAVINRERQKLPPEHKVVFS